MGTDGGLVSGRGARWGGACDQVECGRLGTPVRGAIQGRRSGPATDNNKRERRKEKKMSQRTTRRNNVDHQHCRLGQLEFRMRGEPHLGQRVPPGHDGVGYPDGHSFALSACPSAAAAAPSAGRASSAAAADVGTPAAAGQPPAPREAAADRPPGCGGYERPRFTPEAVVVVVVVAAAAAVVGAARRCPTAPQLPAACASRRCHPGKPAWRWRRPPRRYAARKHGRP